MANKQSWHSSKFWLDSGFIQTLEKSESNLNMFELAGYKRAIANFVKILTKRNDLNVKFSTRNESYTNGNTIVISSKLDQKLFDSTVGLALHEASHCSLTDFKLLRSVVNSLFKDTKSSLYWPSNSDQASISEYQVIRNFKTVSNIIEDRRIDYYVMTTAKGYRGYYQAMYDKYFNDKMIDRALKENQWSDVTVDNYINHIINFTNPNRNLRALPGLAKIWRLIDLQNISRLTSTQDTLTLTTKVLDLIYLLVATHAQSNVTNNIQNNTQPDQSNQDDRIDDQDDQDDNQIDDQSNDQDEEQDEEQDDNQIDDQDEEQNEEQDEDTEILSPTHELNDRESKRLEKAISQQRDFLDNKVAKKNINERDSDVINALAQDGTHFEDVKIDGYITPVRSIMLTGWTDINKKLMDSYIQLNTKCNVKVEEGFRIGAMLGRKLQSRNEERTIKTTRLNSGKIDRRLLSELGFDSERIFSNTLIFTSKESFIHIDIDASGSMNGSNWSSTIRTTAAIAKAASMLSNVECEISIRCTVHIGDAKYPVNWIVYQSKQNTINQLRNSLSSIYPAGTTPEGLCFESIRKHIISKSKSKDVYFINISDGEPGFATTKYSYSGTFALNHTRNQIKKFEKDNINVLAYFIGRDGSKAANAFKFMYGKSAAIVDVYQLGNLVRTMNNLLKRTDI